MAYLLYRDGWVGYEPTERDKGRSMIFKGRVVQRDSLKDYLSHDIMKYIEFYINYKFFGFPYLAGWAEQPCHVLDIIKTLEIEDRKWQMT